MVGFCRIVVPDAVDRCYGHLVVPKKKNDQMKPGLAISERVAFLRETSFLTEPSLSIERARILTEFYKNNEGKYPVPILRDYLLRELCSKQTLFRSQGTVGGGTRPCPKPYLPIRTDLSQ
jgi:hypothetical protein